MNRFLVCLIQSTPTREMMLILLYLFVGIKCLMSISAKLLHQFEIYDFFIKRLVLANFVIHHLCWLHELSQTIKSKIIYDYELINNLFKVKVKRNILKVNLPSNYITNYGNFFGSIFQAIVIKHVGE